MPIFDPPYRISYPRFHPDDSPIAKRVLSFYRGGLEGITVYVLNDGSVTQIQPEDVSTISKTYRGGYRHEITAAEAIVLTNAGYAVISDGASVPHTHAEMAAFTHANLALYTHAELAS